MLNVLLADDETRTLHHLMTGVPWFQLGMEVCCTASNVTLADESRAPRIFNSDIIPAWTGWVVSACA